MSVRIAGRILIDNVGSVEIIRVGWRSVTVLHRVGNEPPEKVVLRKNDTLRFDLKADLS